MDDGGWQMLNQYVVMKTLGPDAEKGKEGAEQDSDDDEDWMDDGDDDDDDEEEEGEEEDEEGEGDGAGEGAPEGEDDGNNDDAGYVNRTIRGLAYSALNDEHTAESDRGGDDNGG